MRCPTILTTKDGGPKPKDWLTKATQSYRPKASSTQPPITGPKEEKPIPAAKDRNDEKDYFGNLPEYLFVLPYYYVEFFQHLIKFD